MRNIAAWTTSIELAAIVIAISAAIFVLIAAFMARVFGSRAIWRTWALYFLIVGGYRVYLVSGLRSGLSDATAKRTFIYVLIEAVWVGIPLAFSAYVLNKSTREKTARIRFGQLAASWGAALAGIPIALLLREVINRLITAFGV